MKFEHFFLLALGTLILALTIQTFYHENVHKSICETYDGNATITYLDDITKGQIGLTECYYNIENEQEIRKFNAWTDLIGYHIFAVVDIAIILVFIVVYILKFDKKQGFRIR